MSDFSIATASAFAIIGFVRSVDLHFKVEVDLDNSETAQRLAEEIRRAILKIYGVRKVELTGAYEK